MLIYAYLPFYAEHGTHSVRDSPIQVTAKCSELQADTIKVEVKEIRIIP